MAQCDFYKIMNQPKVLIFLEWLHAVTNIGTEI